MSLQDCEIKSEYRSLIDNVAKDFYVPLLKEATSYKRAVGFFSSSVLVEISKGIGGLIRNGGKIKIIASPHFSDEDIKAIRQGYSQRVDICRKAVLRELREPENEFQADRLNYLSNLIADGYLGIKIAVTESDTMMGMYHEKMGIITDAEGNRVAFSGSMNDSANALLANYETIDVFTSWSSDEKRVSNKEASFAAIWDGYEPGIKTMEFDEVSEEMIRKYRRAPVDYKTYNADRDIVPQIEKTCTFFRVPDYLDFFWYQKDAMDNWIKANGCGIFDMATGAGKTYTALGAITKLSQLLNENIAVVIVAPYQHLVEQWVEDLVKFNVMPIIAYSYPGQKWREQFKTAVSAYNVDAIKNFCIISTNATFASDDFQTIIKKFRRNFCFVVDEAHNFGAKKLSSLLPKKARYRLALSATIERYRDEEGTAALKTYFGARPCIQFTLKDAIDNGFLTPYYYYPIVTYLNAEELENYNDLTKKIIKCGGASKENCERNPHVELLLIQRARIIAGCRSKVDGLIKAIEPFKNDNYILVYCGATKYDRNDLDDTSQIKQIDEVNYRLYNELGMRVRKFTSSEDKEAREDIRAAFASGEELQVITAIKCLDEGVNIPAIKKAFILASSTNPKEYIQRRGRVLRKAPGKEYAEIFDFITLPRPLEEVKYCSPREIEYDLTLVRKEFERMKDFADTARNPFEIDSVKAMIENTYYTMLNGGCIDE